MNGDEILNTNDPLDDVFYLEKNAANENNLISAIQRVMQRAPTRDQGENKQIYTWFIDRLKEMVNNPTALEEIQEHLSKGDVQKMTYALDRLFDEKYQSGYREGELKGESKGIEKGIEKGKQEALKEVAMNMLLEGAEPRLVERITGIPLEELQKLKSDE